MFEAGKFMDMLKKAAQMQSQMQEELRTRTVVGEAGAGMVTVTMNGVFEVQTLKLDPSLWAMKDHKLAEEMIVAAFHDAMRQVRDTVGGEVRGLASQLGL